MTHPTATLDEVWALFKETDREFQETKQMFQETGRRFQETENMMKVMSQETDRRFEETKQMFQETDRRFEETKHMMKIMSQETDRRFQETSKKISDLGSRLGDFVEGLIKPSVVKLFQERGIIVHKISGDIEADNQELGLATQIDLLVVNRDTCIVIEVKSRLSIDDINDHLERMKKFKPLFPEYEDKQVFGAVASMVIADDVAKYAYRKGFFVIGQRGEYAVILNDEKFKPMAW